MPRPRLLVTGFSAFPGALHNPTEVLIGALDVKRLACRFDIDLAATVLPTEYAAVSDMLPRLWTDIAPDAVLHLGLHGRADRVRVETRGANYMRPVPPDAAGRHPDRIAIEPGGPLYRRVSVPAAPIAAALRHNGIPSMLSADAGGYLCNYTLYRSLARAGNEGCVGFIHVPWPQDRRAPRAPARRPGFAALARAVEIAIAVNARTVRNRT